VLQRGPEVEVDAGLESIKEGFFAGVGGEITVFLSAGVCFYSSLVSDLSVEEGNHAQLLRLSLCERRLSCGLFRGLNQAKRLFVSGD